MKLLELALCGLLGLGVFGLESRVYAEEQKQTAPWKEVKRVRDLTVDEMLKIEGSGYTGLVTVCDRDELGGEVRFEGYGNREYIDDNMYQVLKNLAVKFTSKKVYFSWFNFASLLNEPYNLTPKEIEKFMQEKWKIKITDLPVTIMYYKGKRIDWMSCGPKDETWIDAWTKDLKEWIRYNFDEPEVLKGNWCLKYEGICVGKNGTRKQVPLSECR